MKRRLALILFVVSILALSNAFVIRPMGGCGGVGGVWTMDCGS